MTVRPRIFLAAVILLLIIISGCTSKKEEKAETGKKEEKAEIGQSRLREGDIAPSFTLSAFDGRSVSSVSLRGAPLVLNFWASWCQPCRIEAKTLEKAYNEFKGKGVFFLGVSVDDNLSAAKEFVKEYGLTYPNGLDKDGAIGRDYGIYAIPETLVIDRSGRIVFLHIGAVSEDVLREGISKALD